MSGNGSFKGHADGIVLTKGASNPVLCFKLIDFVLVWRMGLGDSDKDLSELEGVLLLNEKFLVFRSDEFRILIKKITEKNIEIGSKPKFSHPI